MNIPHKPKNEWQRADGRWDWPKIRQAYLSGRWPSLEMVSQEIGSRPGSQVRKVAAEQDWNGQKASLERKAEEQARERILGRLTREFEKRLSGMLNTADVLRYKALQTLGDEKMILTGNEAIRAAVAATEIEREIFIRRGTPITGGDDTEAPIQQGVNPGLLNAPATLSEIPDDQLLRIIDIQPVERQPAQPKDVNHARGSGRRSVKAKGSKV